MSLVGVRRDVAALPEHDAFVESRSTTPSGVCGVLRVAARESPLRIGVGFETETDFADIAFFRCSGPLQGPHASWWTPEHAADLGRWYVVDSTFGLIHRQTPQSYNYDVQIAGFVGEDVADQLQEYLVSLPGAGAFWSPFLGEDPSNEERRDPGQGDQTYDWRTRIEELRRWTGDPRMGEAPAVSQHALEIAEWFARYVDIRAKAQGFVLSTVIAPLPGGGVHLEWNVRNATTSHLEIEVYPEERERFGLLRTEETGEGRTIEGHEISDATPTEVLSNLARLLEKARRARSE